MRRYEAGELRRKRLLVTIGLIRAIRTMVWVLVFWLIVLVLSSVIEIRYVQVISETSQSLIGRYPRRLERMKHAPHGA